MEKKIVQATQAYTLDRGDVCVGDNNSSTDRKKDNVVDECMSGNTRIKICDDYCYNRTPEEVYAILKRIADRAQKHLSAQVQK
jgi:hypothetical protein